MTLCEWCGAETDENITCHIVPMGEWTVCGDCLNHYSWGDWDYLTEKFEKYHGVTQ